MNNCAFLSMDNLHSYQCYDNLLIEPLKELGWTAKEVSWRNRDIDWNRFDAVIIRSPWDYQQDPQAFLSVLQEIEASSAILENSLELVQWNIDKTYLRSLQKSGIEIVPSIWRNHFEAQDFLSFYDQLETKEIIIKPTISAGADDTFWISRSHTNDYIKTLSDIFKDRSFLVQPFMPYIQTEGEFSVFFFGEIYSHTILKTPKAADFRVQEEHGGRLKTVKPEEELLKTARAIFQQINPLPLYTRADYVRTTPSSFALMELELIEPSLYFNMDKESPYRFARIFNEWMEKQ